MSEKDLVPLFMPSAMSQKCRIYGIHHPLCPLLLQQKGYSSRHNNSVYFERADEVWQEEEVVCDLEGWENAKKPT